MKAEHRHELKTNELAQWLSSLPAWAQQNLRTIIYVTVVVVIVAAYTFWYYYQKGVLGGREQANMTALLTQIPQLKAYIAQTQTEGADNSYMLMQPVNGLEQIAAGAKNDSVAALTLIKQADILRTELHFRPGPVSRQDLENQINRAKGYYTKALVEHLERNPNRSLEAMAKLGLGLCEEELGNLDQARKIYDELATGATFEGTTSAAAAKQRLILMGTFNQKIVLMPTPRPVTAAPTEPPAILPAPESQVQIAPETNAQVLK